MPVHVHLTALNELHIIAILIEAREVPRPARYLLLREQHVRHGDGAEARLADEPPIVGTFFRIHVHMDVNIADGALPGGVALGLLDRLGGKDEVHTRKLGSSS